MVRIILRNSFKGLGIRALSALVLGPIAFAGVWLGGYFFAALISIIAVIVSWEWGYLVSQKSPRLITVLGSGLSLLGIFAVSSQQASWVIGSSGTPSELKALPYTVCAWAAATTSGRAPRENRCRRPKYQSR